LHRPLQLTGARPRADVRVEDPRAAAAAVVQANCVVEPAEDEQASAGQEFRAMPVPFLGQARHVERRAVPDRRARTSRSWRMRAPPSAARWRETDLVGHPRVPAP
jgi:hypothetical protein